MKKVNSQALLEQLEADTRQVILIVHYFLQEDPGVLLQQPAENSWSAAQAIEHLNTYGRYYLPAIEKKLNLSHLPANNTFKTGWMGNYFANLMLPRDGRVVNKMKTPKNYRPPLVVDSKKVMDEFLAQQQLLLKLLEKAGQTNIGKIRVPISLTRFIRLKLGDTFRFLVAHHQRHIIQAQKAIKIVRERADLYNPVFQPVL